MSAHDQANTTALIAAWSMDGARSDLDGRFGSPVDIHAVVAERDRQERAAEPVPPSESPPLLVKAADAADWKLLPDERAA